MASVFLSHSSRDHAATKLVIERLRAEGFAALFLDFDPEQGIAAGRSWERELYAQLRKTDAVVFLASADSVASPWCFAELSLARSLSKPICPIRLHAGVRLALVEDVQWIDLSDGEPAFASLLAGLRQAGVDPSDSFAWDPGRPPFPGLEPFASEDAAVFFGRDAEVDRLVDLLQPTLQRGGGRFVAIVGPSGSGKSSLLFAGLLPRLQRLERRWLVVPALVPGSRPTENLAHSLATAFDARGAAHSPAEIRDRLHRGGSELVELAAELSRLQRGTSDVLVVIDQAEELITRSGADEQRRFLELLDAALRDDSPLWVVATVRSEFLSSRPERAGLAEAVDDVLVVEPLSRARLPEVIVRPAQRAGLDFAPGLAERMVEEATGGDALPLLAYTLRELYGRAGRDGLVTVEDYEAVGGVVGALRRRADRLLDELNRRGKGRIALPTLLKLAAIEGEGEPTRRRLPLSALDADEREIVDAFVDARLLTTASDTDGEASVGVAHEALLRQWPPLREAIETARDSLAMRSDLDRLAADWEQAGRDESYLLRGGRLDAADTWAREHADELSLTEHQFLDASRGLASRELDRARRTNRRLRVLAGGLAALLLVALGAGLLALQASEEAESQARLALSRQLSAQADRLVDRQPDTAVLVGLQSLSLARDETPQASVPAGLVTGLARLNHASTLLAGHRDQVHEVAFSREGKFLVSASWDRTVRFWNRSGEQAGRPLAGQPAALTSVALSPDGELVAFGGEDGILELVEVGSKRPQVKLLTGFTTTVTAITFTPDGNLLVSAGEDGIVRRWEVTSGRAYGEPIMAHGEAVRDVEASPDGTLLATASDDDTARLWDAASGQPRGAALVGHRNDVWGVAFSPDGKLLASASADKTVRLWSLLSGQPSGKPLTGHTDDVWDAAFSPDGKLLASGSVDRTVRLWEVASGEQRGEPLRGHTNTVKDVKFSPDGDVLASAGWDGTVRLWEVAETHSISQPLLGHDGQVFAVRASRSGKVLASGGLDGAIRLWELPSGLPARLPPLTGHRDEVNRLAFSPGGRLLASVSSDGTGRVWEVSSGRVHTPPLAHGGEVYGVAFSPDGELVATGGDDKIARLWDVDSGRPHGPPLKGHEETIWGLAFSPDGKLLATASGDQSVRLWDVASGAPHGEPLGGHRDAVYAASFSPDGRLLATAGADETIRLWDLPSGRQHGPPLGRHGDEVLDVEFNRDGRLVATASRDGTARLWNVPSGGAHGPALSGHSGVVWSAGFARGGQLLATASEDQTVRLWKPSFTSWVSSGCKLVNRNLSISEWNQVASGLSYERTCPDLPSGRGAPADAPAARY